MKVLVFGHRADEEAIYDRQNHYGFQFTFTPDILTLENVSSTKGYEAVFIIVSCIIDEEMAQRLKGNGVRYILTRAAGKDHLDIDAIRRAGLLSAYVPVYSPNAISEHAILLTMELLRKRKEQVRRMQSGNLTLIGLRGVELRSQTVGVVGTGRIGMETLRNLRGFGCHMLAHDRFPNPEAAKLAEYVPFDVLLAQSDVVLLHCPMSPENHYMIDEGALAAMKPGALLVNTARGGLVDSQAALNAINSGHLGGYAFDVYEFENCIKRMDYQDDTWADELLKQLMEKSNVIFTSHIAFYTVEAVTNMIGISIRNLHELMTTQTCANETML